MSVDERLQERYHVLPNGCWEWRGSLSRGYGRIMVDKVLWQAHRLAYVIHRGRIPNGMVIDHLCRYRACVRPDHLEAVSMRTNILRGVGHSAANARKTHCPQGHPYDRIGSREERRCRRCQTQHQRTYVQRRRAAHVC